MTRIYHTWEKWECYPAGFYNPTPPDGMTAQEATTAYAAFLRDDKRFARGLSRVISEWPNSCEHYLSNEKMNRVAWLGQASMCIETRVPEGFRGGFNKLSPAEQDRANKLALKYLNKWLTARDEPETDLEGAGVAALVNLY